MPGARRIFILEDNIYRTEAFEAALDGHDITIARDTVTAAGLWTPPYDLVLLDHDLGDEVFVNVNCPNTGSAFVRDVAVQEGLKNTTVVIHSWNHGGALHMAETLLEAKITSAIVPFGKDLLISLRKWAEER